MKKFLFFLMPLVAIFASCASKPEAANTPELKFDGMAGDILSVKTYGYMTEFNDRIDDYEKADLLTIKVESFDEFGHLVNTTFYDETVTVTKKETRQYAGNRLVAVITTDGVGAVIKSEKCVDKLGKDDVWEIVENGNAYRVIKSFSADGLFLTFDMDRQLLESKAFDKDNHLLASYTMKDGKIAVENKYSYDKDWNLIKVVCKSDGEISSMIFYEPTAFDEKGNWTESFTKKDYNYYILSREITYR